MSENPTLPGAGETPITEQSAVEPLESGLLDAIKSAVNETVESRFSDKFKAIDHEFRKTRHRLRSATESGAAVTDDAPDVTPENGETAHAWTRDDVKQVIDLGRQVPDAIASTVAGFELPPTQEAAILQALIESAKNQPASPERDARKTQRAATSAVRESVQWPKSQAEYNALRVSDPKRHAELVSDPSFFPTELPYR